MKRTRQRREELQDIKQVFGDLSQAIEADAQLVKALRKRPSLAYRSRAAALQSDVFGQIHKDYLRETTEGLANLLQLLALLEVPADDQTGLPTKDRDGRFISSCVDGRGRLLLGRFMVWVRINYLWPLVESQAMEIAKSDPERGKRRLRAIFLLRQEIGEGSSIEENKMSRQAVDDSRPTGKPLLHFVM